MTYKQDYNRKYNFKPLSKSHSLKDISMTTGYELKGLKTIYNKGIGAFKTNPQSVRPQVKSAEMWAMARVYASINPKSKSYKIDKSHLIKKNKNNNKKSLTDKQLKTLEKHSIHHTKKHMDMMKKKMMEGMSFNQAHILAQKSVGK
jgi:hypothetical protein